MLPASPLAALSDSSALAGADATRHAFRFRLFPLGLFTGLFEPEVLREAIREGCEGGFRILRREFTVEPRRVLFFLAALGFGMIFRRNESAPEPEYDWRVAIYKTRLLTKTVDVDTLQRTLNDATRGGFELHYALKFPTRFLFLFPRESYLFVFRRPIAGEQKTYSYEVQQTPYRFFTRTIDAEQYESNLNRAGQEGAQLKVTFRDERRLFGFIVQPTAIALFERVRS